MMMPKTDQANASDSAKLNHHAALRSTLVTVGTSRSPRRTSPPRPIVKRPRTRPIRASHRPGPIA